MMHIVLVIFILHIMLTYTAILFSPAEILSTDVTQMDEVVPDAGLPQLALQVLYI